MRLYSAVITSFHHCSRQKASLIDLTWPSRLTYNTNSGLKVLDVCLTSAVGIVSPVSLFSISFWGWNQLLYIENHMLDEINLSSCFVWCYQILMLNTEFSAVSHSLNFWKKKKSPFNKMTASLFQDLWPKLRERN